MENLYSFRRGAVGEVKLPMGVRLKVSLSGTLILLSIYLGVVASEMIAFINTTTTTNLSIPYMIAFFMGLALVCGFIGFYILSELVPGTGK